MKRVLDACCGSRMFWFDRQYPLAVFMDCRQERWDLRDSSSVSGVRHLRVNPDVVADYRAMPFVNESFDLVIFDPPHFIRNGATGWMAKKYGTLNRHTWKDDVSAGFAECFRVLRLGGTLVFKWNEADIKIGDVLKLAPCEPLVGTRFGKRDQSYWFTFYKALPHHQV